MVLVFGALPYQSELLPESKLVAEIVGGVEKAMGKEHQIALPVPALPPCLVTYRKPIASMITVLIKSCRTYVSDCGIIAVLGGAIYSGSIDNGKLRKRDGESNPLII